MLDLGLPVVALAVVEPVLRRAHVRRQVLDVIGADDDALVLHDLLGIERVADRALVQRPLDPRVGRVLATLQRVIELGMSMPPVADRAVGDAEIGRAQCRESVCQYVWISVVAVYLNKNKITETIRQITNELNKI